MVRVTTQEKREIGLEFIRYLSERELIRTWHRPDLAPYYSDFIAERRVNGLTTTSFSTALFVLGRIGRRELLVRGGTIVVFRGTSDFRTRSQPVIRKISTDFINIRIASEKTEEWRPGCIRRKVPGGDVISSCIELQLHNITTTDISLENCALISRSSYYQLKFAKGVKIAPSEKENVAVRAVEEGEVQTTELEITIQANGVQEKIIRYLKFEGTDGNDDTGEPDERGYTQQQFHNNSGQKRYVSFQSYIPGEKPDTLYQNKLKMVWTLPYQPVPKDLDIAINQGVFFSSNTDLTGSQQFLRDDLFESLNRVNYKTKFTMLLHMEEHQNKNDIKQYDMECADLNRKGNLFYLHVPGLAEKRPSVLRGDRVYVKPLNIRGEPDSSSYEGYVHHVEQERAGLGFSSALRARHLENQKYYVRFDFNRLALRLMHRSATAIVSQAGSSEILFPSVPARNSGEKKTVRVFNRLIERNREQKTAVEMIASGETSKVFIIFGPPGTGKTITMVEAIHQVLRSDIGAHMLVCAPSNSACDLLTTRLLQHVDSREILRMHAASRNWNEVPSDVKQVSNYENQEFCYPAKEELKKCRIIVTTLITAGRIASASFPKDHFKYVFIDEAGQAMEPETMIAVAGVLANDGKLVMAGDPKQLGPVVRSSLANTHGLEMSFLERLMTTSSVHSKKEGGYDSASVVKLLKNYRSHESIIEIPNELFYENGLQVFADEMMRNSMANWEKLPKPGFPIIFHGVQGDDRQESNSPSYFNMHEVKLVKKYVDDLLSIKGGRVKAEHIGVICPYRKQVQKIRQSLKNNEIKVGSVEEFQGQERLVIIVSTVRSDTKHLQVDRKFNLGFLRNPKRFNVAVTRAKALLITIGNPRILCLDKHWRSLLEYCMDKGGYTGLRFTNQDIYRHQFEEMQTTLENLALVAGSVEVNVDQSNPQWRQDP